MILKVWIVEGDDLIDVYLYICLLFPAANVYYYFFLLLFVSFFGWTLFDFDVHQRSE